VVTFAIFSLTGGELTAEIAFTALGKWASRKILKFLSTFQYFEISVKYFTDGCQWNCGSKSFG
jgi:hypothetical protein